MSTFSAIYAEIQNESEAELQERIAYAKHMKTNFQTMIEACHKAIELRRATPPPRLDGAGEILGEIVFTGVLEGRPMFEFQAMAPPAWMVEAIKNRRIQVIDGMAYANDRILASGDIVAESEFL
jgi:hypothetical protein